MHEDEERERAGDQRATPAEVPDEGDEEDRVGIPDAENHHEGDKGGGHYDPRSRGLPFGVVEILQLTLPFAFGVLPGFHEAKTGPAQPLRRARAIRQYDRSPSPFIARGVDSAAAEPRPRAKRTRHRSTRRRPKMPQHSFL